MARRTQCVEIACFLVPFFTVLLFSADSGRQPRIPDVTAIPTLARETVRGPHPISPELRKESAIFIQRRLGVWTRDEAERVLGKPYGHRDAHDGNVVTGDIYAFADPTGRYREFELMFNRKTGRMSTAFIYPWRMTWRECRELWGDQVKTMERENGYRFYSYVSRNLDVLTDKDGNVINLGLY